MKTIATLFFLILFVFATLQAQNQSINGNLHLTVGDGGTLRIGKINDGGNTAVPLGSITGQYNIDFSGYRDVATDQIGARIAAIRYNKHLENKAYIQNTSLVFYTNTSGLNAGTTDLVERMRISPGGYVGIGTSNPTSILHLHSSSLSLTMTYSPGGVAAIRSNNNIWVMGIQGDSGFEDVSLGTQSGEGKRTLTLAAGGAARLKILANGNVGIGTDSPQKLLDVKGTIHAQNIEVDLNNWSDFVFDKDYKLPTLQEVEAHINEHKRLPDIPSEKQVKEEGINIGEMQAKLLQKIEELTLYVIELKKENNEIKQQLNNLQHQ